MKFVPRVLFSSLLSSSSLVMSKARNSKKWQMSFCCELRSPDLQGKLSGPMAGTPWLWWYTQQREYSPLYVEDRKAWSRQKWRFTFFCTSRGPTAHLITPDTWTSMPDTCINFWLRSNLPFLANEDSRTFAMCIHLERHLYLLFYHTSEPDLGERNLVLLGTHHGTQTLKPFHQLLSPSLHHCRLFNQAVTKRWSQIK